MIWYAVNINGEMRFMSFHVQAPTLNTCSRCNHRIIDHAIMHDWRQQSDTVMPPAPIPLVICPDQQSTLRERQNGADHQPW